MYMVNIIKDPLSVVTFTVPLLLNGTHPVSLGTAWVVLDRAMEKAFFYPLAEIIEGSQREMP